MSASPPKDPQRQRLPSHVAKTDSISSKRVASSPPANQRAPKRPTSNIDTCASEGLKNSAGSVHPAQKPHSSLPTRSLDTVVSSGAENSNSDLWRTAFSIAERIAEVAVALIHRDEAQTQMNKARQEAANAHDRHASFTALLETKDIAVQNAERLLESNQQTFSSARKALNTLCVNLVAELSKHIKALQNGNIEAGEITQHESSQKKGSKLEELQKAFDNHKISANSNLDKLDDLEKKTNVFNQRIDELDSKVEQHHGKQDQRNNALGSRLQALEELSSKAMDENSAKELQSQVEASTSRIEHDLLAEHAESKGKSINELLSELMGVAMNAKDEFSRLATLSAQVEKLESRLTNFEHDQTTKTSLISACHEHNEATDARCAALEARMNYLQSQITLSSANNQVGQNLNQSAGSSGVSRPAIAEVAHQSRPWDAGHPDRPGMIVALEARLNEMQETVNGSRQENVNLEARVIAHGERLGQVEEGLGQINQDWQLSVQTIKQTSDEVENLRLGHDMLVNEMKQIKNDTRALIEGSSERCDTLAQAQQSIEGMRNQLHSLEHDVLVLQGRAESDSMAGP